MTQAQPTHWHDQIADRTREAYAASTSTERLTELEEAAYTRIDVLCDAPRHDYDAQRERAAWNELARVCIKQRARRVG